MTALLEYLDLMQILMLGSYTLITLVEPNQDFYR